MAARVTASQQGDHLGQLPGGGDGRRGGVDRGGAAAGLPLPGGQGDSIPAAGDHLGQLSSGMAAAVLLGFLCPAALVEWIVAAVLLGFLCPAARAAVFPLLRAIWGNGEGLENKAAQGFQGDHRRREKIFLKKSEKGG